MVDFDGIERQETTEGDVYIGTTDQLIAAGLIRADQLPPTGRLWVTFVNGQRKTTRGAARKDESFLRVRRWNPGRYWVCVGVPAEVRRQRQAADRAQKAAAAAQADANAAAHAAAHAKARREQMAKAAQQLLAEVPRTADAFRMELVREVRHTMRWVLDRWTQRAEHGYTLAPDSLEHAMVSVDAVVEAILQAEVRLDHAKHLALVSGYQARMAAGAGDVSAKLARLLAPNPDLLSGEVEP